MPATKEQIRQIIADNNLNNVADVYSLLKDSFTDILQELMEAELDASLGYEKNQKGDAPRDREGEFEPKLIPKYQRDISGIEEKVISLYARAMSTRDIHDQIQDLYGMVLSAEMVSKITDKILPEIKEWQSRPLNPVYSLVFMDCIHYKVREDRRIMYPTNIIEGLNRQYRKVTKTKSVFPSDSALSVKAIIFDNIFLHI